MTCLGEGSNYSGDLGDNLEVQSRPSRLLVVASLFSVVIATSCVGNTAPNVIRIGVDLPLSGAEGRAGAPARNGIEFFVHQHPSIDGFNVEVMPRDDAVGGLHNPVQGELNVKSLAADPLVLGVIGPFDSNVARLEIPIANVAHLALISPAVSSRCLTKEPFLPASLSPSRTEITCKAAGLPAPSELRPTGLNNFFRLATTDELQGPAAADYAYRNLKLRRVAALSDHEAYGQALAGGFQTRFTNLGGSIVEYRDFDPAAPLDLKVFMRRAAGDGAQAIYFGGVTANHGCVARAQMASQFGFGETAPFLGGDGIAQDPECVRNAGPNAIGIFATVPAAFAEAIPGAQPVISAFKAQYGNPADYGAYTIAAYDSAGVLYAAIDRAIRAAGGKLPGRDHVVNELSATTAFAGAGGTFGFDGSGDTTLRVVSLFESTSTDPNSAWAWVKAVDYSAALPY
jgi:branched-chain amino acid transport system substrate-binding protein